MASLSVSEIRGYAQQAGFTGADIDIAAAVALAESGGNPKAHSSPSQTRDDSYGLWQINMIGSMGPDRRKKFGISSNDQLYDPAVNAKAAYIVFKEQGWARGWTTYGTTKYDDFLKFVKVARNETHPLTPEEPKSEFGNPLAGVPDAISAFSSTLFKGATNVGGVIVAISFLSLGIVLLIASSKTATKAASIAANVVPGGSVIKQSIKKAVKP